MTASDTKGRRSGANPPDRAPLAIELTPAAAEQMRAALASKPEGFAIRLFVAGGAHPSVGMTVDRPSERDEVFQLKGVPIAVDSGSRPFLDSARVDFVTTSGGSGFSVTGPNTPATAPAPSSAGPSATPGAVPASGSFEEQARAELKKVYDPEIPMNIVDLGLIYAVERDAAGKAQVRMTMTTPGCPVIEMLLDQVRTAVASIPGTASVDVEIVWDPPWGPDRMSEFAKRQLGFA